MPNRKRNKIKHDSNKIHRITNTALKEKNNKLISTTTLSNDFFKKLFFSNDFFNLLNNYSFKKNSLKKKEANIKELNKFIIKELFLKAIRKKGYDLKKRILLLFLKEIIFEINKNSYSFVKYSINQISKELNTSYPQVHSSVKELIKENFLLEEEVSFSKAKLCYLNINNYSLLLTSQELIITILKNVINNELLKLITSFNLLSEVIMIYFDMTLGKFIFIGEKKKIKKKLELILINNYLKNYFNSYIFEKGKRNSLMNDNNYFNNYFNNDINNNFNNTFFKKGKKELIDKFINDFFIIKSNKEYEVQTKKDFSNNKTKKMKLIIYDIVHLHNYFT